jgi:CRP-like cAMP-binding protein
VGRLEEVPAGSAIVQEGDPADALYVITDGQVDVSVQGDQELEQHLATLGPGEYFGEIGLLARGPRMATVRAVTDVVVERIPGDDFVAALNESGATAAFLAGARTRLAQAHPSRALDALRGRDTTSR